MYIFFILNINVICRPNKYLWLCFPFQFPVFNFNVASPSAMGCLIGQRLFWLAQISDDEIQIQIRELGKYKVISSASALLTFSRDPTFDSAFQFSFLCSIWTWLDLTPIHEVKVHWSPSKQNGNCARTKDNPPSYHLPQPGDLLV